MEDFIEIPKSIFEEIKKDERKQGAVEENILIQNRIKETCSKIGFSTPAQAIDFCIAIIQQRKEELK